MKKLVVFGLLAAIGAVTFIERAQAGPIDNFCSANPSSPSCGGEGPMNHNSQNNVGSREPYRGQSYQNPGSFNGDYGNGQPYNYRNHRRGWNNGYDYGPNVYFNLNVGRPATSRCSDLALSLRQQGFYNVRPLRCAGSSFLYRARRDGETLNVSVSPYSGRIRSVVLAY